MCSPNQDNTHAYTVYDWIGDPVVDTDYCAVYIVNGMVEGDELLFNGTTDDPNNWWCSGNGELNVLISVKWNGMTQELFWVPNLQATGCNLVFTAETVSCPVNDQDCDGFLTGQNIPQSEKDCEDTNSMVHPDQAETWGDNVDYDCNGHDDPPSWQYQLHGLGLWWDTTTQTWKSYQVQLADGTTCSNGDCQLKYPMPFVDGAYRVNVGTWVAPTNYVILYRPVPGVGSWSWSPADWNGCQLNGLTHAVYEGYDSYNVPVPFTLGPYCHYVKQ